MMGGDMHHDVQLSADGRTLAVHVPIQFRKRSGRKVVIAPTGASALPRPFAERKNGPQPSGADTGLVRALAQAHRWQAMLDEGTYATVGDLARAEKLDKSFVSRMLRLTLLAPDIVEAILDGRQDICLQRQTLLRGMPLEWTKQRAVVRSASETWADSSQANPSPHSTGMRRILRSGMAKGSALL